jgi:hypothetical protein
MEEEKKEKSSNKHYVKNADFLKALIEFKAAVNNAKDTNLERPVVPRYIGECFMKIAEHLSYRPNFINYTFKADMISDGIENCLMYMDNFNPDKSDNPFAYFTQIIYYAFLRRIIKEKKQIDLKIRYLENMDLEQELELPDGEEGTMFKNTYIEYLRGNLTNLDTKEIQEKRNKKSKKKSLETFMDEQEEDNDEFEIVDDLDEDEDKDAS